MPWISREDLVGAWHHVVNRAIERRMMFERRADFRFFCAQLARSVLRGAIELHAFCLMGTHDHLLVRSPLGNLGTAMGGSNWLTPGGSTELEKGTADWFEGGTSRNL
jgi:hypothetical protein